MDPNSTNFLRREWLLILVLILPFIALAIVWPMLPSRVPMHFDAHGNVNRYGSPIQLLILPGISILVSIILYFVPRLDPKKANIMASLPAYFWIRVLVATMLTYVFALMLVTTFYPTFDVTPLIATGLLALFVGLGLTMPKLKQNYLIGIRLPWTLESEDNWNRTHAFAGKLWPLGAIVGMALTILFPSAGLFIAIGVLIVIMIWTGIYSYRIFRDENNGSR